MKASRAEHKTLLHFSGGGLVSASNVLARSLSLTSHLVLSLKYIQCITTRERFLLIIYACMIKCQYECDSEQSLYSNA